MSASDRAVGEGRPSGQIVTTQERECREVVLTRAGHRARIDHLVPDRYTLADGLQPDRVPLYIWSFTCSVNVDGHPARETTATLVGVAVTARDGEPANGYYLLAQGTDNPEMAARYGAAGLPTEYQHGTSATETQDAAGLSTMTWSYVGGGLDYELHAVGPTRQDTRAPATATYYHDSPQGNLVLAYRGEAVVMSRVPVAGDLTGASAIVPLLLNPLSADVQGTFWYFRLSQDSQLSRVE